jgi:hypothetical protein
MRASGAISDIERACESLSLSRRKPGSIDRPLLTFRALGPVSAGGDRFVRQ